MTAQEKAASFCVLVARQAHEHMMAKLRQTMGGDRLVETIGRVFGTRYFEAFAHDALDAEARELVIAIAAEKAAPGSLAASVPALLRVMADQLEHEASQILRGTELSEPPPQTGAAK